MTIGEEKLDIYFGLAGEDELVEYIPLMIYGTE